MNVLDTVLPIFLVIGLGYALVKSGFVSREMGGALSRFVFYVCAPALLARATAGNSIGETFNAPALIVVIVVSLLVGGGTYALCWRCRPDRRGVIAQGAFRSNQVFIGIPLVIYAYGEESLHEVAVLLSFTVILYNFLGAVLLILPQQDRSVPLGTLLARTAAGVLRNPLILACLGGILYSLTGWSLPTAADRTLELLGRAAAPLALVAVGTRMSFHGLRDDLRTTLLVSLLKDVLYPALVLAGLLAFGLTGHDLVLPALIMTSPTAVVGFIMARELGGDESLAGAIIIGSTLLSLLTISGWLVVLQHLA